MRPIEPFLRIFIKRFKADLAAAHDGVVGDEGDHQPRPALAGADLVGAERRPLGQAEHHLGTDMWTARTYYCQYEPETDLQDLQG